MTRSLPAGLAFAHHDADAATRALDTIVAIHVSSRADRLDDPFYSAERFAERVRGYIKAPGFELVTASVGGEAVGQAFGYTLPEGARWWTGMATPEPEPGFFVEDGRRTFAFNELMVEPRQQGRGVAHALHDELLNGRPEPRATLLVRPDNPAGAAYARWGWRKIGEAQPFPDSPRFHALIIDLPVDRA